MIIQRTKTATPLNEDDTPQTSVHFAEKIDPTGNVTLWTSDKSQACGVDEETLQRVKQHYKKRPNAGKLETVKGDGKKAEVVTLTETDKALAEATRQIKFLQADLADTKTELKNAEAEVLLLREENERLKKIKQPETPKA